MRRMLSSIMVLALVGSVPAFGGWDEGVAAFKAKNYQQAAQEFEAVVKQSPEGYQGYYMLGLAQQQLNKNQDALTNLRKAYDLNPNDLGVKLALGQGYHKVKRHGDVAKLLDSVDGSALPASQRVAFYQMRGQARLKANNSDGAVKDFAALAKLKPDDAQVQYLYGTAALAAGQDSVALSAIGNAVKNNPNDKDMRKTYAQALVKKGRMTRDKNAKKQVYAQAAEQAKALVALDSSYDNLMLKVSAELGAGLYSQAAATGQQAVAKKNNDWLAHFYIGQALSSQQKYAEAVGPLNQAKSLCTQPNDLKTVWRQLGFVYEKQKKYADSVDAYNKAGDQSAAARVQKNQETESYNSQVEAENARIKQMEAEAKKLEEELKKLEGGGGF